MILKPKFLEPEVEVGIGLVLVSMNVVCILQYRPMTRA